MLHTDAFAMLFVHLLFAFRALQLVFEPCFFLFKFIFSKWKYAKQVAKHQKSCHHALLDPIPHPHQVILEAIIGLQKSSTLHISRKWAFFGLLSHAFFPLLIHLFRENFDFECTNIIKHRIVIKSKKRKEFTVLWAQYFSFKQSSP